MDVTGPYWWQVNIDSGNGLTSHYLIQCWPRFMSPGITKPQAHNELNWSQKSQFFVFLSKNIAFQKNIYQLHMITQFMFSISSKPEVIRRKHIVPPTNLVPIYRPVWKITKTTTTTSRLFTQRFIQGRDQRKHQSSASLAFVWGIHRWPENSPHKWPVTMKMFPFDDVIMNSFWLSWCLWIASAVSCPTCDKL